MKEFIKSLILLVLASVLTGFIGGLGFLYSIVKKLIYLEFNGIFKYIGGIFFSLAVDLDKTGNFLAGDLLNDTLKKEGYKYGHINETVSSATGKNELSGTQTKTGEALSWLLNAIDENHCIKSVNNQVNNGIE